MRALLAGALAALGYLSLEVWSVLIVLDLYKNPANYLPIQEFAGSWMVIVAGFAWGVGLLLLAGRMQDTGRSGNGPELQRP